MLRKRMILPALLAATMLAVSPAVAATSPAPASTAQAATRHASLRIDVGRAHAPWVGEAVPITVTAAFRDVDQVTLEGALRVTSPHVVTTSLSGEPKQWQERVGGVPTLMVRWTGTVTPAAAGPLDLEAELPVRVGYRDPVKMEAHTRTLPPDPFGDDDLDPFGDAFASSMFRRMQEQMRQMQKDVFDAQAGSLREEATTLSAKAPSLEARALPAADRPATFNGAVGHFDVSSSLGSSDLETSDPVTLRIVVEGEGDLDRVDLAGVPSSATWKTYPAHVIESPAAKPGTRARKVFEQTLVPLTAGAVTVPPVALDVFDPATSKYVTRTSAPIAVTVAQGREPAPAAVPAVVPSPAPPPKAAPRPSGLPWIVIPVLLALGLVALAVVTVRRRLGTRRAEAKLRRRMRSAAAEGAVVPFAEAARDLIRARLAKRWGVVAEAVTMGTIRERLGEAAKPLLEALALDSAVRFGGGAGGERDLRALAAEVEVTLASA